MSHFNMNSGLFYLRANPRTIELMQRLETRLAREKYWDQSAYNEEMFILSHGDYKSPQVGSRDACWDQRHSWRRPTEDGRPGGWVSG
jgi:hypothetical protein